MEHHFFIFLLLTGLFPLVLSLPRKYYLIQKAKTWSDAQTYCRATHVDLATIEPSGEMIKLQNVAQTQQFVSDAWVGLYYDVNFDWHWSFANQSLGTETNWCNYTGSYACSLLTLTCWGIHPCGCTHPFICFDDRLNGSDRYLYYTTYMSWFDAQTYCRTFHTDLASARDATENSLIWGKITQAAWFGLIRGSWKWSDQTTFTSIMWKLGQPNFEVIENCNSVVNGTTSNYDCSLLKAFYCYRIITGQQQMLKFKVQSSMDVNDDATIVALLDKIKQKLIEHGLQKNVMVTWRTQPDGKVFHNKID